MPETEDSSVGARALEALALGQLPHVFPFRFQEPTDAASPYSLCLALFPEAELLPSLKFRTNAECDLPEGTAFFVKEQCVSWHWTPEALSGDESVASVFAKTWLRKTDETYRKLDLTPSANDVDTSWVDGVVRVLQLWRKFDAGAELSLLQFEQEKPEVIFDALIHLNPPSWSLRQKLEFLVLPYLRYVKRMSLLQTWITGAQELEHVADAVFAPEVASALLQLCLSSVSKEWPLVQRVLENIHPQSSAAELAEAASVSVTWESLFEPTSLTLEFFGHLVDAAKTARFPEVKFQQLAEWTLGDPSMQRDLLIRFLQTEKHVSRQDLETLRQTVYSKIPEPAFATEVIRASLASARFMFIKSFLADQHSDILKREVAQMVERFGTPAGAGISLQHMLTTLELVDADAEVTDKFQRLQLLQSTFGIDPVFALSNPPIELVRYALEHGTQVYLRFSQLQNVVAGKGNGPRVAELCVEAALADDNFSAACELIDRGFVKQDSSGAWLALYEVGKYVSPQWDLPRPVHILQKQQQYLSRSISLCPEGDLTSVLRAWSLLEQEHEEGEQQQYHREAASSPSMPSVTPEHEPASDSRPQPGNQLSNLLVSGIGWAIGANP